MSFPIVWAKRVSPLLIKMLYENDAKGIIDCDIVDEVGIGLYARAESFIKANVAHGGLIDCPACGVQIHRDDSTDSFSCSCGWSIQRKEYHNTYKGKQLIGVSVVPFAQKYINDWNMAGDRYSAKMSAIDSLIHTFHRDLLETPTRPAAINFIEGNLGDIVRLIFDLAYGDAKKELNPQMEQWLDNARKSHWVWNHAGAGALYKEKEGQGNRGQST